VSLSGEFAVPHLGHIHPVCGTGVKYGCGTYGCVGKYGGCLGSHGLCGCSHQFGGSPVQVHENVFVLIAIFS